MKLFLSWTPSALSPRPDEAVDAGFRRRPMAAGKTGDEPADDDVQSIFPDGGLASLGTSRPDG